MLNVERWAFELWDEDEKHTVTVERDGTNWCLIHPPHTQIRFTLSRPATPPRIAWNPLTNLRQMQSYLRSACSYDLTSFKLVYDHLQLVDFRRFLRERLHSKTLAEKIWFSVCQLTTTPATHPFSDIRECNRLEGIHTTPDGAWLTPIG